jgi:MFS family permease
MARRWWTLAAVCGGVFMLLLDITIVNVALPDIQAAFGASLADLQWVIDAYALTLAALLLTAGSLADRFGRRRLFVIGTSLFTIGSLACGLATDSLSLSLSRAGQGVGGAIMFATALALLSDAFEGRERGVAFGVFGATTGVAVAVGPVLGGVLTSGLSWRWIFLVNIPVGIVTVIVSLLRVDESRDPDAGRPDWLGFATFSSGLGLLVLGLIRSGEDGWTADNVVWSLGGAAVLLVAFVATQVLQASPMFDLSLFRKPTFVAGMASGVNSTFRQIGIATGIAALGSIFSHQVADGVRAQLADTPLHDHAGQLSSAVTGGQVSQVISTTAPGLRGLVANAARTNFIDALNHITLIAAVLAFAAGVLCLLLIRQRDLLQHAAASVAAQRTAPED